MSAGSMPIPIISGSYMGQGYRKYQLMLVSHVPIAMEHGEGEDVLTAIMMLSIHLTVFLKNLYPGR